MKKIAFLTLFTIVVLTTLESCSSSKLCPAYNSYPEARARR